MAEWTYRGKGSSSIVYGYSGSDPSLRGWVLRVPLFPLLDSETRALWHPILTGNEASVSELHCRFVQKILAQSISSDYLPRTRPYPLSDSLVRGLQRQLPELVKVTLPLEGSLALLMEDVALRTPNTRSVSEQPKSLCVELKPKSSNLISVTEKSGKASYVSRYQLHQRLKYQRREICAISDYSPLDFFSGDERRVRRALKSLFANPQNNLALFSNGEKVFGGDKLSAPQKEQENIVASIVQGLGVWTSLADFESYLVKLIAKCPLFDQLKRLHNIGGAGDELCGHPQRAMAIAKTLSEDSAHLGACSDLDKDWQWLRDYLTSATAKDISVMILISPALDTSAQVWNRLCVVDLEPKRLGKLCDHLALEMALKQVQECWNADLSM